MDSTATLRVMGYGKWSDRFGGDPQPYEFVDLYDHETGEIFTWSLDSELDGDRPEIAAEAGVSFTLEKRHKPAQSVSKKDGKVYEYVREALQARVVGFGAVPARSRPAPASK